MAWVECVRSSSNRFAWHGLATGAVTRWCACIDICLMFVCILMSIFVNICMLVSSCAARLLVDHQGGQEAAVFAGPRVGHIFGARLTCGRLIYTFLYAMRFMEVTCRNIWLYIYLGAESFRSNKCRFVFVSNFICVSFKAFWCFI